MEYVFCLQFQCSTHVDQFSHLIVPVFDATQSFNGKHLDMKIDFSKISQNFPLYQHEILDGDLVAVAHSIFFNHFGGGWVVKYGVYFVVLLAREANAQKPSSTVLFPGSRLYTASML